MSGFAEELSGETELDYAESSPNAVFADFGAFCFFLLR